MKKTYIQPESEIIRLNALDDFLSDSTETSNDLDDMKETETGVQSPDEYIPIL